MVKILKETMSIINKNLWLLFLFMTISYLALVYFSILKNSANSLFFVVFGLITLFLIAVVGVAGFFNTLKSTIFSYYKDKDEENIDLIKSFPKGVAEYFFSAFGIIVIYFISTMLMFGFIYVLGTKFIGTFSFSLNELSEALVSTEKMAEFTKNLSLDDFSILTNWYFLYVAVTSVFTYLLLFWLPETFYNTKNSLISFVKAVGKSFFNPAKTLKLFFTIVLINIFSSVLMSLMLPIPILSLFVYFVYFYSLLYVITLIFNYYRYMFCEENVIVTNVPAENEEDIDDNSEEE